MKKSAKLQGLSRVRKIGSQETPATIGLRPQAASNLKDGAELGGWAGADPESTVAWFSQRLRTLRLVEVRGRIKFSEEAPEFVVTRFSGFETGENPLKRVTTSQADTVGEESPEDEDPRDEPEAESEADRKQYGLPREIVLRDGTRIQTRAGTVPKKSHFACAACGRPQDILESVKPTGHTAPVAPYALQCHCPECDEEGYNYSGRYFKTPDAYDLARLERAEREWAERKGGDLKDYWPEGEIPYSMSAHVEHPLPGHGYTHWWKMFNPRQLLVHTQLLRAITDASEESWPLDVRQQALGAFQQYLRMMCMFSFWHQTYDKLAPSMSNANYHPKKLVVETNAFGALGYGRWPACQATIVEGLEWCRRPWDPAIPPAEARSKSIKIDSSESVRNGESLISGTSSDLSLVGNEPFDLVITDPPFNNRIYYADLADFFYVWLRLPLLRWYDGLPEREYFVAERSPHAMEAQRNPAEYPDDREGWEKEKFITARLLSKVQQLTGDNTLVEKAPNPLYRPDPATSSCRQILTACWSEANRLLKPGGLMAFTFHHSEDEAWVDVLESLFDAGFSLVAAYPIRSDETKGEHAQFGSQKIEYDIIHVCRKRLEAPQPMAWARMRHWVRDEAHRLKDLLEHTHGKTLPEPDLRVILRGKALEFYSRHYGKVLTGQEQVLSVRDALLGINQLLDDLLAGEGDKAKLRPPEAAEPTSRLFLRLFLGRTTMTRDELHKTLRGTGVSPSDLEALGWLQVKGTTVHAVSIADRFDHFTAPGRTRKVLKTDLDQAQFLIGAAIPGSGIDVTDELNRRTFALKRSVDDILSWHVQTALEEETRKAAALARDLVSRWRTQRLKTPADAQLELFDKLEEE